MNELETLPQSPSDNAGRGFHVSGDPVVSGREAAPPPVPLAPAALGELPASYGGDLLYVIARDPRSLFVYWDVDWTQLFDAAGLAERPVHLRTLREDGTEESGIAIDPAQGSCFVDVGSAGLVYSCELGCYEGFDWKSFIRSASTATPEAEMSENGDADFASVPFHLGFQRLIDIFRANGPKRRTLANSIADMQTKARALQETMPPAEWSRLIETASALVNAEAGLGLAGVLPTEFSALLRTDHRRGNEENPSPGMLERWRKLGERYGGSSWGGSSPGGASWGGTS